MLLRKRENDVSLMTVENVTKSYRVGGAEQTELAGIDLSLQAGEFVGLVGPSGCGKTTLLNICGLIDQPDSGQLSWHGQSLKGESGAALTELRRRTFGFVFQQFNLIPVMSARDNISYPLMLLGLSRKAQNERVESLANAVGIGSLLDKRPAHLSGGQRQRVAIARALAKRPELIIADEPTASLDEETALTVVDLLRSLSREFNTTVLVATHDARLSRWCDRLIRLHQGHLQVDPGHVELFGEATV
jgi:putative ABC transport system ATP-binding protein